MFDNIQRYLSRTETARDADIKAFKELRDGSIELRECRDQFLANNFFPPNVLITVQEFAAWLKTEGWGDGL